MANHKSALKRHRQSLKARERNKAVKTRVKNATKAVRAAIEQKDSESASKALQLAASCIDKAAKKNVIHWRAASRKISRLSRAVNNI
ncbi:30S ribosomal protein S20 [Desulfonatronovibrio magnus]|uniref:30S ribosomal protein S20 n=1 Tax=Desulfonatronovibrio magnus TaxID=698827 RepID=UPI0005EBCD83|nr:30S ribosomal protein S20 [Desulfonatronovibrio magnus]RQD65581.1 MAG: 30S ribosomal protein S20 [Desulfonatronovibrio sp. MSAO_Bac4]